jgi:hypothetical protein
MSGASNGSYPFSRVPGERPLPISATDSKGHRLCIQDFGEQALNILAQAALAKNSMAE